MKKIIVFTFVFCAFLLLCFTTAKFLIADEFFIHAGESQREVQVVRGRDFTVSIEGKGWYLNRYQRTHLAFRMRVLKPDRTIFRITPLQTGVSYLLFSHLERDVYVTVTVLKEGESSANFKPPIEKAEGVPRTETVVKKTNEKPERGSYAESKKKPQKTQEPEEKKVLRGEKQSSGMKEGPTLKTDVYYTDKNRVVRVPTGNESDLYRDALSAMERDEYETALKNLAEYLDTCTLCTYRVQAHFALADIYGKEDAEKALTYLDGLGTLSPSLEKKLYLKKAALYMKIGDRSNAIQSYKKAYDIDKNDIDLLQRLGDLYYEHGDFEEALEAYETGILNGLSKDETIFRVASIYDKPGPHRNIEKAYRYYRRLVDEFASSRYRVKSLERVRFFEENFYNYR